MDNATIRDRIIGLERVKASDLAPHPMNPRTHPSAQMSALQASIESLGYASALLAYRHEGKLRLFDGHARRSLTPDSVVPVLVTDLTEAEARQAMLTFDPLSALAETDAQTLANLRALTEGDRLEGLIAPGPGLDALLGRNGGGSGGLLEGADPDAIPQEVETRCKSGDLWALGEHRLLCGDSTKAEDVARLLRGQAPILMVTDPPYGIRLDMEWRDKAGLNIHGEAEPSYMKRRERYSNAEMSYDDRADWSDAFSLVPSLQVAYVWHASSFTREVLTGLLGIGFEHSQQIIWNKGMAARTRTHYWYQHEPCWYVRKKNAPWYGRGGTANSTVWDAVPPKFIFGGSHEEKVDHPTQKPAILWTRAIENHVEPGSIVYEPFSGSGTCLIACEQMSRICRCLEIEPRYVDVALARWEAATGRAAERLEP